MAAYEWRNYLTIEDIPLLIDVVFSTASMERVWILELLLESKEGTLSTSQITASLNTSSNTAKRTMAEFKALGIADITSVEPNKPNSEKQIVPLSNI
jgi:Fic family protein